ncbi:MAG: hypothetical protein ACREB8_08015 [Pseudolabrys sp.]
MDASSPDDFSDRLARVAADSEVLLGHLLAAAPEPGEIARPPRPLAAMRRAALGGGKATPVFALGPDGAHAKLAALIAEAEAALAPFGVKADTPRAAARFTAERRT